MEMNEWIGGFCSTSLVPAIATNVLNLSESSSPHLDLCAPLQPFWMFIWKAVQGVVPERGKEFKVMA